VESLLKRTNNKVNMEDLKTKASMKSALQRMENDINVWKQGETAVDWLHERLALIRTTHHSTHASYKYDGEDYQPKINKLQQQVEKKKRVAESNRDMLRGEIYGNHGKKMDKASRKKRILEGIVYIGGYKRYMVAEWGASSHNKIIAIHNTPRNYKDGDPALQSFDFANLRVEVSQQKKIRIKNAPASQQKLINMYGFKVGRSNYFYVRSSEQRIVWTKFLRSGVKDDSSRKINSE